MAKRRRAKSKSARSNGKGSNLGFEQKLWLAADKLRNNMDAAEYTLLSGEIRVAPTDKIVEAKL